MIGLSVSMRCAGPESWTKVVHLPGYPSRARTRADGDIILDDSSRGTRKEVSSHGEKSFSSSGNASNADVARPPDVAGCRDV